MCIKAEDNFGFTIADDLNFFGDHVDGIYFDRIDIYPPFGLTHKTYTINDGSFDLGVLLLETFGDEFIQVIDTGGKRIYKLQR
ncbi:MAG: hypothetical protein U9N81_11605 [Bacillota bacterium]|nr:hypothetical protein [Bacillota bacterium]